MPRNPLPPVLCLLAALSLLTGPARAGPSRIAEANAGGAAAAPSHEPVGLYPLQLPEGLEGFAAKLMAQLREGALGLPRVRSVEPLPAGACQFDEPGCLADVVRAAKETRVVSGRVKADGQGFSFELRLVDAADARELGTQSGAVLGGPQDLEGGLEHGLCALLGGDPCTGTLHIESEGADGTPVEIDGTARGALPLAQLELPVGRHVVRAGGQELRVRVSYLRETEVSCSAEAGAILLQDKGVDGLQGAGAIASASGQGAEGAAAGAEIHSYGSVPSGAQAAPPDSVTAIEAKQAGASTSPRSRAARLMASAGGALLMTAGGLELYSRVEGEVLDHRYRSGQLTSADEPSYGHVHAAGVAALLVGALGAGALATGGLLFLLAPGSAGVQGTF